MKKMLTALILMLACTVANSAVPVNFFLIQGPQFTGTPAPYSGTFKGDLVYPRSVSAVLSNGEGFSGRWISATKGKTRLQDPPVAPAPQLSAAWDAVYGQGFFVSHVLGAQVFQQTILTGSKGSVLRVEIYRKNSDHDGIRYDDSSIHAEGVAQDDKGNIYKVVF